MSTKKSSFLGGVCTIIGTVMGAGFISGRELIEFFGGFNIFGLILAFVLFYFCFYFLYRLGEKYGGYQGVINAFFSKKAQSVFIFVMAVSSLITSAGMLSALSSCFPSASPFLSLAVLVFACFVSDKGIGGIMKINTFITPLIISCIAFLICKNGKFSECVFEISAIKTYKVFSYVFLNGFIVMPVVCDTGYKTGRAKGVCGVSASVIVICASVILSAVGSDTVALNSALPLTYILKNGRLVFSFLCCVGMATTMLSAFYPLTDTVKKTGFPYPYFFTAVCVLLLSFVPFQSIVGRVYPVLAVVCEVMMGYIALKKIKSAKKRPLVR